MKYLKLFEGLKYEDFNRYYDITQSKQQVPFTEGEINKIQSRIYNNDIDMRHLSLNFNFLGNHYTISKYSDDWFLVSQYPLKMSPDRWFYVCDQFDELIDLIELNDTYITRDCDRYIK